MGVANITTLTNRQYCVILDPVGSDGKPQLGQKKLIKGEKSFFLEPGERLEKGIQNVYVLGEDEGLILKAIVEHTDPNTVSTAKRERDKKLGEKDVALRFLLYITSCANIAQFQACPIPRLLLQRAWE